MRERILDQFEHLAVELGLGAVHFELDLLAEFGGKVAHDARQLLPGIADRLHARLHHAFLQLGGDVRQPLQRHLEVGILVAADDLEKLVAGEHEFGNRGHEVIERVDMTRIEWLGEPFAALVGARPRDCREGRFASSRVGAAPVAALRRLLRRERLRLCGRALHQAMELLDEVAVVARGSRCSVSISSRMVLMRSMVESTSVTASVVTGAVAEFAHQDSAACASASSRGSPRKPQVPLMVWTRRKMLPRISPLFGSCSKRTSSASTTLETLVGLGQELPSRSSILTPRQRTHFAGRRHPCACRRRTQDACLSAPGAERLIGRAQSVAKGFNFGCGPAPQLPEGPA
jgi:hypothetical protein